MNVPFEDILNLVFGLVVGGIGVVITGATWFGLSVSAVDEWDWDKGKALLMWLGWLLLLAPGTWIGINTVLWALEFIGRNVG